MPLADSLDRLSRRLGGPASGVMTEVFSRWEAVVGPDIAAHSRPLSLKGGVLVLGVDQPAWASQLQYMTADLLARIAAAAGSDEVGEIRVRVVGDLGPGPGSDPPLW